MSTNVQWLCLIGGFLLFLIGIRNLYREHDAVVLVISVLIVGFTLAKIYKTKRQK